MELGDLLFSTFATRFKCLSGKTLLFVDSTFNFNAVELSVGRLFPDNLKSLSDSKCVLGYVQFPTIEINGICATATGPAPVTVTRNGTISGFVCFDDKQAYGVVSDAPSNIEELLLASDSVGVFGERASVIVSTMELNIGADVTFFQFTCSVASV